MFDGILSVVDFDQVALAVIAIAALIAVVKSQKLAARLILRFINS